MKSEFNPCHALTVKGSPCKKPGTVPVEDATGREFYLCGAHASAALHERTAPAAGRKTAKNAPPRAALPEPSPTPAPGPKWAAAEPRGPFSANTIRRQIERLERRDRKPPRPLNGPSRYARPEAVSP